MTSTCVDLKILPVKKNFNLIKEVNKLALDIYILHYKKCLNFLIAEYMYNAYQTVEAIIKAINEGEEYYILNLENKNIGYFATKINNHKKHLFISKLYLDSKVRGKKLGKYIMDMLIEKCKKLKIPRLQLYATAKNPSVNIYKKWGFKILRNIYRYVSPAISENYYLMAKDI